jgi:hypothetical protein
VDRLIAERECWPPRFSIPQVASGDLHIAIIGQLPSPDFPLSNQFESGPV